jgi:programmed cell death protein 5
VLEVSAEEQQESDDKKLREAYAKRVREMRLEQQRRELVRTYMTSAAYERLMNVKMANNELYQQLLGLIIRLAQSGKATSRLTEEQLKSILAKLTYRPEGSIEFRHK